MIANLYKFSRKVTPSYSRRPKLLLLTKLDENITKRRKKGGEGERKGGKKIAAAATDQ